MRHDVVFITMLGAGAVLVSSCAPADLEPRAPVVVRGDLLRGGGSSDVLHLPPATERLLGGAGGLSWEGPEYWRRDEALAYSPPQPLLATRQWAEPPRPSLERTRYVWIPTHPNLVEYRLPEYWPRWDPYAGWWWYR
jgi:hypothetical protein